MVLRAAFNNYKKIHRKRISMWLNKVGFYHDIDSMIKDWKKIWWFGKIF